jgi:hypothetical protein
MLFYVNKHNYYSFSGVNLQLSFIVFTTMGFRHVQCKLVTLKIIGSNVSNTTLLQFNRKNKATVLTLAMSHSGL